MFPMCLCGLKKIKTDRFVKMGNEENFFQVELLPIKF